MRDKDFAEPSGKLSGAICLKTLVLLGSAPDLLRRFLGAARAIFWLWGSSLALEKQQKTLKTPGISSGEKTLDGRKHVLKNGHPRVETRVLKTLVENMSEASLSVGRQRVGAFKKCACRQNAFKQSYTVECGNRLRVGVRAKNASVSGLRAGPSKEMEGQGRGETRAEFSSGSRVCEGQKVPQSLKPQKIQSDEKVTLGVDPKVTKSREQVTFPLFVLSLLRYFFITSLREERTWAILSIEQKVSLCRKVHYSAVCSADLKIMNGGLFLEEDQVGLRRD